MNKEEFIALQKKVGSEYPCQHCGEKEAGFHFDSIEGNQRVAWCSDCQSEYNLRLYKIEDMRKDLDKEFERYKYKWWENES